MTAELANTRPGFGFFILTNSRALHPPEARALISEICRNLKQASLATGTLFEVVLRGDSTLRGHFPLEPEVVEEELGSADVWLLAPFFLQGGRCTIDDVHYVTEGDELVPAGETPFAGDATFGYRSSNLKDWVVEKCTSGNAVEGSRARVASRDEVVSLSLQGIREEGPGYVERVLVGAKKGSVVIVNAAEESDVDVVVLGVLQGTSHLHTPPLLCLSDPTP